MVPGLGTGHSGQRPAPMAFDDIQRSMWRAEARPHLGRRVALTVKNSPEPIRGSLVDITDDGVLLDRDGVA